MGSRGVARSRSLLPRVRGSPVGAGCAAFPGRFRRAALAPGQGRGGHGGRDGQRPLLTPRPAGAERRPGAPFGELAELGASPGSASPASARAGSVWREGGRPSGFRLGCPPSPQRGRDGTGGPLPGGWLQASHQRREGAMALGFVLLAGLRGRGLVRSFAARRRRSPVFSLS